jgi:hypothetical protein
MSGSKPGSENSAKPRTGRGKVRGSLADINVGAHVRALLLIWASDTWRELWNDLGLVVDDFPALGLA